MKDLASLPLRVFFGVALATHGYPKLFVAERAATFAASVAEMGFFAPAVFATLAGISELVGGVLIATGLLTRPAALAVITTMSVAALVRHAGDPFSKRELALTYLFIALFFAVRGGGPLSLGKRSAALARWS